MQKGTTTTNSIQSLALEFLETKSELSFKKVINRLKPGLLGFVNKYVKDFDLSNDIISQTFQSVWEKSYQYDSKWNFSTWVYGIAKYEALNALRLKKKYLSHERLEENHSKVLKECSPEVHMEIEISGIQDHDVIDDLHTRSMEVIYNLDEPYKSIMIEKHINELQLQQIAKKLKMNLSTVKTRLRKARKVVAKNLLLNEPTLVKAYHERK